MATGPGRPAANGGAAHEPPLEDPPRSTSSAMPDPKSPCVPRLTAEVHQRLEAALELQRLSASDLQYRPLSAEDMKECRALHTEWFPLSYDEAFYNASVSGDIYTLSAALPSTAPAGASEEESRDILGIITVSTKCEHHGEDIENVLGGPCSALCPSTEGERVLQRRDRHGGAVAYILTLGVIDGFRRRGLAKELLRRSVAHIDGNMPDVHAVYLHVVTYNQPAIELYESMEFVRIANFPDFYHLHGKPYDSYLYALYIHGGRPPWRWRWRQFFGRTFSREGAWTWMHSAWSSILQTVLPGGPHHARGDHLQDGSP